MSAGLDKIDIPAVLQRNIKLGHTPKVLDDSVANTTILLILATTRRMQEGRNAIEK